MYTAIVARIFSSRLMPAMAFAFICVLLTASFAGAQANPCASLQEAGVDCDFVEVGLFEVNDDEIAVKSDPVRFRDGFHIVACCDESLAGFELGLVTVLESEEVVEGTELVDGCLGHVFASVSAIDEAVREPESAPEMVTLKLDDASEATTVVELRALRSASPSSELCRGLHGDASAGDHLGTAFIIFFNDGDDG